MLTDAYLASLLVKHKNKQTNKNAGSCTPITGTHIGRYTHMRQTTNATSDLSFVRVKTQQGQAAFPRHSHIWLAH